jgi:hypothetical protein
MATCVAILASLVMAWPFGVSAVRAQGLMRSPTINLGSRIPSIGPGNTARINPTIASSTARVAARGARLAGRGPTMGRISNAGARGARASIAARTNNPVSVTTAGRGGPPSTGMTASRTPPTLPPPSRMPPSIASTTVAVLPTIPYVRYLPNTYPGCAAANPAASGECNERPFVADLGGGPPPRSQNMGGGAGGGVQAALNRNYVPRQIVAEFDGALTADQADALARRLRLARIASQDFPLIGATISLFRITDNRSVEAAATQLRAEAGVRAVQPNFRYVLQDQTTVPVPVSGEGDPAQYALAKLRLPEAHKLAYGSNVTVAVIDSGIDAAHRELAGTVVGAFDALDSKEGPHVHGTGIAGAIVSHARLMGSAPRARILAIRAFGVSQAGAASSSFVILKGLNRAAMNGAQVINMSFAGPQDPLIERGVAASASKGIVMVAASGNAGPTSPPLYPAAYPSVIAVSATDAYDKLFAASNRGSHIAVAAPGVDIFLPAPDNTYQMTSGTSFSAAYISGLAALMIERNPQLRPDELRAILTTTARDLGAPGRDDLFGAGEADAYRAVSAVSSAPQPVAAAPSPIIPALSTEPTPTSPSIASGSQK